jgi:hypothetical protein
MPDWKDRLTQQLEPLLKQADPRQRISAYHDMPYAIFRYPPEEELAVRQQVSLLRTRPEQIGKRITTISLAECLNETLEAEGMGPEALVDAEKSVGLEATVETIFQILSEYQPLDELVARRIPDDADPQRDLVLIVRAGALFPMYRTSALLEQLLEQLKGKVHVPAVLFYPGALDGTVGLRFMGVLDAEHNYRPKIFLRMSSVFGLLSDGTDAVQLPLLSLGQGLGGRHPVVDVQSGSDLQVGNARQPVQQALLQRWIDILGIVRTEGEGGSVRVSQIVETGYGPSVEAGHSDKLHTVEWNLSLFHAGEGLPRDTQLLRGGRLD